MIITLTQKEADLVVREAHRAHEECKDYKKYNTDSNYLFADMIGGGGEFAVCKYLGHNWRGFNVRERDNPDALNCEVRTTQQQYGRLLLNERDIQKQDRKFVHVISRKNKKFELMGWAYGYEVIKDENIFSRPQFVEKIWKIENNQLRPIATLMD